jgi:outer membrane protein assembly factor BamB
VKDSLVLVTINRWEDPRIVALNCETGDSVWTIRDPEHIKSYAGRASSPALYGDLLILHQNMKVVGYNTLTGKAEWWLSTPTVGVSTPVIHEDVMYVGGFTLFGESSLDKYHYDFDDLVRTYDNNLNGKLEQEEIPDTLMVYERPEGPEELSMNMTLNDDRFFNFWDKNKDRAIDSAEWAPSIEFVKQYYNHGMLALPVTGKGELSASDLMWKVSDNTPETPSPLVVGDNVFFIKNGGIMTVINRVTGEVVKNGRVGAAGAYLSSPMLAGNRVYTCSYNGTVTVLSADDFSVLANNKLKERIGASPVSVDDVLYVRTDRHLYAFRDPN